jgi:hypothetical protein
MDVYLVIGNTNTRKATLVRSLTGCFNRSVRDIALRDSGQVVRVYARVGALQETKTTPDDLVAEVQRARCQAVLCCLSPGPHATYPALYPDAPTYIGRFQSAGWRIHAMAVLGQNAGGVKSPNLRQFPLAPTAPVNVTSRALLDHFGWI